MKSLKLIGLSLLALFALGAFAATASAEEGFLVGGNTTPTTATVLGALSTLAIEGEVASIHCALLDDSTITFNKTDKHAKGTLHWLECTILGAEAHTLGGGTGEILVPVLLLVCLDVLNEKKELIDEFGIFAEVEGTTHIEAPGLGVLVLVKGAAIGAVLTSGKAKLFNVEFKGKEGKQTATDCKDEVGLKVTNLLASTNEGTTFKKASEEIVSGLVTFEKETQLMT